MSDRVVAGLVKRAVGIQGEVEIDVRSDDPHRFDVGRTLIVADRRLVIVRSRRVSERVFVRFEGIATRDQAESIKRAELQIDASDLRELDALEYWDHDLEGCEVVANDETVGTVDFVNHSPYQDQLQLTDGTRIPLVRTIVVEVDIVRKRIMIDPPEGLL